MSTYLNHLQLYVANARFYHSSLAELYPPLSAADLLLITGGKGLLNSSPFRETLFMCLYFPLGNVLFSFF